MPLADCRSAQKKSLRSKNAKGALECRCVRKAHRIRNAMYVREGGEVMKKVVNRMMALFLVLTMVTAGLPQSALTATAAEKETDTQEYAETDAEQQNDTAIKVLESKETTEEYSSETSSKKDSFAKEESTEKQSSERESFEEESFEEESFEEKSFEEKSSVTQESTEDDSIKDDFIEDDSTKEQLSDEQTSDEASSAEISSAEESSVMEETSTEQQETEESSIITETETETEEIKRQEENTEIRDSGYGGPDQSNKNVEWILYMDGRLVVTGTGEVVGWMGGNWGNYASYIKSVKVNLTGAKSARGMFLNCINLTEVDLSGFDMSQITDMSSMFSGCSSLTSLDVSGWDTSSVTNMERMFANDVFGPAALTNFDLSALDTSSVTNMSNMFNGQYNLTNLNVSGWDTSNVTNMEGMFANCKKLETLDLSSWNTNSVTTVRGMFFNCTSLPSLNLSHWNTRNILDITCLFENCENLKNLDLSGFNTENVTDMTRMFGNCINLTELDLSSFDTRNVTNMAEMFWNCSALTALDLTTFNLNKLNYSADMFKECTALKSIKNPLNINAVGPVTVDLPSTDGSYSWRKPDGTRVTTFQRDLTEELELTIDRMIGIGFKGEHYTLQDEKGVAIPLKFSSEIGVNGEQVFDIGSGESFSFTIVPDEGYTIKKVSLARGDSTITLTQGVKREDYSIAPKDKQNGYLQDEKVIVEAVEIVPYQLNIEEYDNEVSDVIIINGTEKIQGVSETAQVSNAGDTSICVKVKSPGSDQMEPVVYTLYNAPQTLAFVKDTNAMCDEEKKLAEDGYYIFHLERLYEDKYVKILTRYVRSEDDIASGETNVIRWVIDKNGRLKVKGTGDAPNEGYYYNTMPWSEESNKIVSAVLNWKGATNLRSAFQRYENLEEVDLSLLDTSTVTDMTTMFDGCVRLKKIDFGSFVLNGSVEMYAMFCDCTSLTKMDLSGLDMSCVTDMGSMFSGCTNLIEIDMSNLRIGSSETNMAHMFSGCEELKTVNFTGMKTGNSTNMNYMFYECTGLEKINMSEFDASGVTNTYKMFWNCTALKSFSSRNLNTENLTNMGSMFEGCTALTEADMSGFDTSNVREMLQLFFYCESLQHVDLSSFHTDNVTNLNSIFDGCKSLESVDLSSFVTTSLKDLSYMFSGCENLKTLDLSNFDLSNVDIFCDMFSGCTALRELKTPRNVIYEIFLPNHEGSKWRLPDGTAVTLLPQNQRESITLTNNRIAVTFTGENFTIKDANGIPVTAGQEILALIGTKEPMPFTIEPTEGYLLKSVVSASQTPTISVEQGALKGQYTIKPLDINNGYLRDEELQVITVPITYSQMRINYPYEGIADSIVVHQGTWMRQMPSSVQISNAGNTMLYVKMVSNNARTVQFPSVIVNSVDENGQWYSKSVPIQSDLSSMGEQEQELVRSGYIAFDLGYLYGSTDVSISVKTIYDVRFELSGFPEEVQIIRYLPDENGVMHGEECAGTITAEHGDTIYFQIKWKDAAEGAYRFCQANISIPENTNSYLGTQQFSGIEGDVWGLTLYNDIAVQAKLEPHRIMLSYVTSDITDLQVTNGNAQISSDMRTLECYGGDALSLSFGLAENITLKNISSDGAELDTTQKDNIYTVTVRDSAKIPQIEQITLETEDVLGRYSLSDLDCKVEYWQSSVPYEGKPVQPAIRRVTVRLPGSKKETVLKEKTDYTISCLNNIQVGEATLVITAAERSQRYRGSVVVPFTISKAAAPAVKDTLIQLEEISAGIVQQIDLSEQCAIETAFEKDVKPIGYRLDLDDGECSLGGVLKGDPVLQGSTLTIHTWPDADKYSEPAVLVVWASFANYEDTRLKLYVQFVKKEELILAGTVAVTDKVYDGMQVTPDPSGVYVAGKPTSASDKIMQELDGWLIYHYTGINGTEYDASEAPKDVGTYQVSVAISENNFDYSAGYISAGSFTITKRPLWMEAESLTLFINDSAPTGYHYRMEPETEEILALTGLVEGDSIISEPLVSCNTLNMSQAGEYPITIDVSQVQIYNPYNQEVTRNYSFDIKEGKVTVTYPKIGSYTVTYRLTGRGNDIIRSGMEAGSLLTRPIDPKADGYVFLGWYKDEKLAQLWDFDTDIIQENMTLYAGWAAGVTENKGVTLCIQQIADQVYTGKALKPAVTVYASDGTTLLKAGKDYSVSYTNNIDADTSEKKFGSGTIPKGGLGVRKDRTIDTSEGFEEKLAYAVVTGKGNYAGTVCMNFHIHAASVGEGNKAEESMPATGFTLKYTDQFEEKTGKNAKIVSSLKYQKTLKLGVDYVLSVRDMEGKDIVLTQKGELPLQAGNYLLTIAGQGNFTGSIVKKLYVSSKDKLMKNAKVTYAKTVKDATREQLQQGITQSELRVSIGGSTLSDNDFEVSYIDNHAIGTAAMTIHGKNGYVGTKKVTFKIKGIAFKEKEFAPIQLEDLTYNGTALTQNDVQLKPINSTEALVYGTDYIIGYKNNIKKGKASVIFTAKASSGYSGSFKKTFTIKPLSLETGDVIKRGVAEEGSRLVLTESIPYRKGGAMPSDRFSLRVANTGTVLQAGKDYTVKYNNNTEVSNGKAFMVLSGKGNFTGNITIYYNITNASLFQLYLGGSVTVTTTAVRFTSKMVYDSEMEDYYDRYENKEYTPTVTVKDGKKTLKEGEDYEISYYGCAQNDVRDWQSAAPYVEIQGIGNYGGIDGRDEGDVITKPLSIYQKKLSANTLYIVYGEEAGYTYTGQQITPEITVYYGNAADVRKARNAKETSEDILTTPKPDKDDYAPGEPIPYEYGLTRLYASRGREGGNYLLEYGENIAQGKNGTIKLTGVGGCTGSVTVKFTIGRKPIYYEDIDNEE